MSPTWLQTLATIYVPLSIASALLVAADIFALGRRQHMAVMDAVWPLTVLYWGPAGLLFYAWFGRAPAGMHGQQGGHEHYGGRRDKPMWQAVFTGSSHCGAGCALGDFAGDWLVFLLGFALFGSVLLGKYLVAFVLAYLFGIAFQYFSIVPMRHLGVREGIWQALKIDTLSIIAYEVGMFGWMALRELVLLPGLPPTTWTYWLMMQVAMVLGFATTYPVNWWLIARGTKERM